jgi:hypothetical protein
MPQNRPQAGVDLELCAFLYRRKKPRPCKRCGAPSQLRILIERHPVCPACPDECMFAPSNRDCCRLMFMPDGEKVSRGKVCVDCAAALVGDQVLHWDDWTRATLTEHLIRPRPATGGYEPCTAH